MKYYASVSFGKDSLAMLFMLIDKGYQLDEVVFYDTGMEFQAIYNTRDAVLPILKKLGIKYTELHPEQPFLWTMFERPVKKRGTNIIHKKGYSWCGGTCRWGTSEKLRALKAHTKDGIDYVGIASTELISTVMSEGRSVTNQIKTRSVAGIGFFRGARPRLGAWLALGVWIDGTKEVGTRSP